MSERIRASIGIGAGSATVLLSAALGWLVAGGGASPEPRRVAAPPPAPRRFDPEPGRQAAIRFAGRLLQPRSVEAPGPIASPPPAAASRASEPAPRPERRSGELVGLEREAARLAEAASLADPAAIEATLARMSRLPRESEGDFGRRLEEERERLLSQEFLLQYRLAQLYRSTEYPPGFDLERDVVVPERQRVAALPAEERETEIRNALESWQPASASPRFEGAPDPALSWQIGQPGL